MPVVHRFDSNIVVIELIDEYSIKEFRATVIKSFEDPHCPQNPVLLIDLSKSRSIQTRSSASINSMASFIASYAKRFNNRFAIVTPDDLTFGLMRMSSIQADSFGIDLHILRTFDEARKWLAG